MTPEEFIRLKPWLGPVWVCTDCGKTLRRPPLNHDGARYHSGHCNKPMIRAYLEATR